MQLVTRFARTSSLAAAVAWLSACAQLLVLDDVERLEVYETDDAAEPAAVIDGATLDQIFSTARCHEGRVLWKGGYPAVFITADGRRRRSRGVSFYGRFVVLPDGRWCEFDEESWRQLHKSPDP